ncbi:circularly permuted type 2 ATP-grasp protein [Nguyenibacter vanlangensis]|uniref:Circularly permuted type 2 ATP-grasp protein n=1 Tax=Nguyenibacter vanlangensis TaxID=1216886 RepID=A0ABZ3D3L7_9PROT
MSDLTERNAQPGAGLFVSYDTPEFFCELMNRRDIPPDGPPPDGPPSDGPFGGPPLGGPLGGVAVIRERLAHFGLGELRQRALAAEADLYNLGITFTVYSDRDAIDRILPFDLIPRVLTAAEWDHVDRGVRQRVAAINHFLWDIYHERRILRDGIIPAELVLGNANYRPEMEGLDVPGGVYVHINGTDLVRDGAGRFLVLEDNARTPSGVSYVIENRHMMLRSMPDLASGLDLMPVDEYGPRLRQALAEVAPQGVDAPQVVLLSPGIYNSAYFEHVFLAREMGVPLVEGRDLVVEDGRVFMRTVAGLRPVHSIYRRLNDDFLDPAVFNPDSMLGVPGLIDAYRRGNVTIANAVGTGVADDKAVYAYMPRIIRYYLSEEPILSNVETHICAEADGLAYTLANLERLVVKPVGESGGYGLIIGPHASALEIEEFRAKLIADPSNYISQPVIDLSVCPTLCEAGVEARHVDLRPFAVTGRSTWVLPGGLSRVALRKGSLVVNSSQGGGSKDTWVLAS